MAKALVKETIQQHARTHTREEPFSGPDVAKALVKDTIWPDSSTHTREKPFSCPDYLSGLLFAKQLVVNLQNVCFFYSLNFLKIKKMKNASWMCLSSKRWEPFWGFCCYVNCIILTRKYHRGNADLPPVPCAFTCELLGASKNDATGFRSVVVITFAQHAKGPTFETGRKHNVFENEANLIHTTFNILVKTQLAL